MHTSSEILLVYQYHRGPSATVVPTQRPRSDSSTDFSTEKLFEITIVKFGLRGVGRVDAGEPFRCLFLGALLQSTAAVHSDGSEAGGLSRSRPNLHWQPCRHVESLKAVAFSPGDWKETVAASLPIFHDGSATDQSIHHGPTHGYFGAQVDGQEHFQGHGQTVCQNATTNLVISTTYKHYLVEPSATRRTASGCCSRNVVRKSCSAIAISFEQAQIRDFAVLLPYASY